MKLATFLNKHFIAVEDYMDVQDDEEVTQYFAIFHNAQDDADAAEPDYFVKEFNAKSFTVRNVNGSVLAEGLTEVELKKFLKSIPKAE